MIGNVIVKFKAYAIYVTAAASVLACRYSSSVEEEILQLQFPVLKMKSVLSDLSQ